MQQPSHSQPHAASTPQSSFDASWQVAPAHGFAHESGGARGGGEGEGERGGGAEGGWHTVATVATPQDGVSELLIISESHATSHTVVALLQ